MNELKPEDVMRALDICAKPYALSKASKCVICPYFEMECHREFIPDVLALLREKDAEIERWKTEAENQSILWRDRFHSVFQSVKETIRADAITEFADKAKKRLPVISPSVFDQIAKEMMEKTEKGG